MSSYWNGKVGDDGGEGKETVSLENEVFIF